MDKRSDRRAMLRGKPVALAVAAAFLPLGSAYALPTGEEVKHGAVTVTRSTTTPTMQIDHTTPKGIVEWQGFSIAAGESVRVNQAPTAALLNRVVGNDPSHIFGSLSGDGKVFLVNNAGVFFAPGSSVSVGSLVASTLSITDQNFINGVYQFYNPGNAGSVVNEGSIVTGAGGFAALLGPQVRNDGVIIANAGKVALGAGERISLTVDNDALVSISVDEAAFNASLVNTGTLQADGGTVMLKASRMNALLDTVINTSGIIRATGLVERNGEIVLDAGSDGGITATGLIDSSNFAGGRGSVAITGGRLQVQRLVPDPMLLNGLITGGTVNIDVADAMTVERGSQITSQNGQSIAAGLLSVTARPGEFSVVRNQGGEQTITISGGGLDVTSAGGFASIANSGGGSQTIAVTGGAGVDVQTLSAGGSAQIDQNGGGSQTIAVTGGDHINVNGAQGNASIFAFGGTQTLSITGGGGANAITIGSVGAFGPSGIGTDWIQNVTAGLEGQSGSITIVGPAVNNALAGFVRFTNPVPGGTQTISTSGLLNITGGTAPSQPGNFASGIWHNGPGAQTITAAGISITGGPSGNGNTAHIGSFGGGVPANAGNQVINVGSDGLALRGGELGSGNRANIFSNAGQTINVEDGAITLRGSDTGTVNNATIFSFGDQTINGNPNIVLTGGGAALPGPANANVAVIQTALGRSQTVHAGSITLTNSSNANLDSFAGITSSHQTITTTRDLVMVPGAAPVNGGGARIGGGGGSATDLHLIVGGSLLMHGGATPSNGVGIGSSSGATFPNNITIEATGHVIVNSGLGGARIGNSSTGTGGGNIEISGRSIQLNGIGSSAAIRTLGNVALHADQPGGTIIETGNGFIIAGLLATDSTGNTSLAGPNQLTAFNGTSGGALTLVDAGTLRVTGITTTNDAITLTTDSLINTGTIANGGPASNANMIFNANAFDLAGGNIRGGAAAVILRPRTGTNSFGIESAGMTTLSNADIATIDTSNFVVLGSGIGTTFTGDMTIGENAQVHGGTKSLAFFRSSATPGAITIGSQGVTSAADVIVGAGGGMIVSNGGTVSGDEVQLRSGPGVGMPGMPVRTDANALAVNTGGSAFVSEADDVTLRTIALSVGGISNIFGNSVGATFDLSAGGSVDVAGLVQSLGTVNIGAAGGISESFGGSIIANTLSAGSASGISLTGPNQVASFSGTSGTDLSLTNSGDLNFTGMAMTGGINLVNTGALNFSGSATFGPGGNVSITNTGALNVASLSGFSASVTNAGAVTVSGPWSSPVATSITTTGAGADLTVNTFMNPGGPMNLNIDGTVRVAASGTQDTSLTAFGGQNISARGMEITSRDGRFASIGNNTSGDQTITVSGGGIDIESVSDGGFAFITNSGSGAQLISVTDGSGIHVRNSSGSGSGQINNFGAGSQAINVSGGGGVDVRSLSGPGFSVISNAGSGSQSISVTGGTGIDVASAGGFANVINSAQGSQTLVVTGGEGVDVLSTGGNAGIGQNTFGRAQSITTSGADHIRVNALAGGASIFSAGSQTISLTGVGSNALTVGSAGAQGFSNIGGAIQAITAGMGGEHGRIDIVGVDAPQAFAGITTNFAPGAGNTQTVATSGNITVRGGNAPFQFVVGTPPNTTLSTSNAGIFNNSSGQQTINAGGIDLHGGTGVNSGAFIGSNAGGNQHITVSGGGIALTGGDGGSGNRAGIVTGANQTIDGNPAIVLRGGAGSGAGGSNNAFINGGGVGRTQAIDAGTIDVLSGTDNSATISAAKQVIATVGDLRITGNPGDGVSGGARIGGFGGAVPGLSDVTLRVGGDLLLTAGGTNNPATVGASTPPAGVTPPPHVIDIRADGDVIVQASGKTGARIGTSFLAPTAAMGNISIVAGGSIQLHGLNGDVGPAVIRTASDVTLNAGSTITQTGSGRILANGLSATASDAIALGGPNAVARFNATSTGSDVGLNNTGVLDVTGMNAFGDATINNVGNVTVSGPWTAGGTSTITVASDIVLNSLLSSSEVVLDAGGGSIVELAGGAIHANELTTTSGGGTSLTGPNQVASFSGTSGAELTLNNGVALNVTHLDAAGNATLTNFGAVALSGPWSSANATITATGFAPTIVQGPAGSIETNSLTISADDGITLGGANQISRLHARTFTGDFVFNNTGTLDIAEVDVDDVSFTNHGSVTLNGLWNSSNSAIAITGAGSDLTVNNQLTAVGTQSIDVAGSIAVNGRGTQDATIWSTGAQTINARSLAVTAHDGRSAAIRTLGPSSQTITVSGGAGIDVQTLSGAFSEISSGGSQAISVINGDHFNLDGVSGNAVVSAFAGPQTITLSGSGANMLNVGSYGGRGVSQLVGASQAVSAGSIHIIGAGAADRTNGFITTAAGAPGRTQTITTTGAITVTGGSAPSQIIPPPPRPAVLTSSNAGIFHNSDGAQTVNAGDITLLGGTSGLNNGALIISNRGGDQHITVPGAISITGGSAGTNNRSVIGTTADQTVHAGSIALTSGAGGVDNSAALTGAKQTIETTGDVVMTGNASTGVFSGTRIGGQGGTPAGPTDLTLNIGGSLLMTGGSAEFNGASIGSTLSSPAQANHITITVGGDVILNPGTAAGARIGTSVLSDTLADGAISVTAGGDIQLNGNSAATPTAIRTLGSVALSAGGAISEASHGRIEAGSLVTTSGGDTSLGGPNEVASFTAASDTGNISLANTAPVLTLGSMELPGSLSIVQAGTLSIPSTVSALSHAIEATGDVLVGSASATEAALLHASDSISIATPGAVIVRGSDVTPLAASAVLAEGELNVSAGDVSLVAGAALATPALARGAAVAMTIGGELNVTGGSGHLSAALLSSGSNIDLTVGNAVRIDAGSGVLSVARIQTEIKDGVINISFPNLAEGGYFVNGIEGRTHQGLTGFFTLHKPAKVGSTLILEYGP